MRLSALRAGALALALLASANILLPTKIRAADNTPEIDPKSRRELEEMESRLDRVIQQHDAAALADMLAEYYADAYYKSTRAITKQNAIALVKAGTLLSYPIERETQFRVSAGTYTVEGEAKVPPRQISDQAPEVKWVSVRRLWIKKEGHWLLVAQILGESEEKK